MTVSELKEMVNTVGMIAVITEEIYVNKTGDEE